MSGNKTVMLAGSEQLRRLVAESLTGALGVETLYGHRLEQERELELIRDHVYEAAASGTEASGPARKRVRAALQAHGEANARMEGLAALSARIAAGGLDTPLTEEDVSMLAGAMARTNALSRAQVENGLYREVIRLDREIMDRMPLSEDAVRKLAEELSGEDATDSPAQDHKVINITDWRQHHHA